MMFRIISLVFLFGCVSQAQWENKVIEQITNDAIWNDLIRHPFHMDNKGKLYVGYTEQSVSNRRVFFRSKDPGGNWSQPFEVPIDTSISFKPEYPTMTINKQNGDIWFAYSGTILFQGRYVWVHRFRGDSITTWQIDTTAFGENGQSIDMTCDSAGNIHLVWYRIYWDSLTNEEMKYPVYAVFYEDTWHKQIVGDTTVHQSGEPPLLFLSVTPDGRAYISNQFSLIRNYAMGSTNWEMLNWINLLHLYNVVGGLVVDKFGKAHLLENGYNVDFCAPKHYLYYYTRDDATGQWSDPDTLTDGGLPYSMFVDSLGNPHVAWTTWYDCWSSAQVIYGNKVSGQWTSFELVNSLEFYPISFDFLIDSQGRGHGTYVGFKADPGNPDSSEIYYVCSNPLDVKRQPGELPKSFELLTNFPNPFNSSTTFQFSVARSSVVNVRLYNILGEEVRNLIGEKVMSAGRHLISWDGKDDYGVVLASGVYFCFLEADHQKYTRKIVLIR